MPAKEFAHIAKELEGEPKSKMCRRIRWHFDTVVGVQDRTLAQRYQLADQRVETGVGSQDRRRTRVAGFCPGRKCGKRVDAESKENQRNHDGPANPNPTRMVQRISKGMHGNEPLSIERSQKLKVARTS